MYRTSTSSKVPKDERVYAFPKLEMQFTRFDIYRTSTYVHVVASNCSGTKIQVLNIDREKTVTDISLHFEKENLCSKEEIKQRLRKLQQMDPTYEKVCSACCIVGIVQFSDENHYYLYVVTEKEKVGEINRSIIYTIKSVELIQVSVGTTEQTGSNRSISRQSSSSSRTNTTGNHVQPKRLKSLFLQLDLSKNFYFSYSYDITNTLQNNMIFGGQQVGDLLHKRRETDAEGTGDGGAGQKNVHTCEAESPRKRSTSRNKRCNEYFVWNSYLLEEMVGALGALASPWITPIIHGYFAQRTLVLQNRKLRMTLVARRSRHFAGPRYLRRGADIQGRVANEVETEQIVGEDSMLTEHGVYTSMVQVRGSIPLHWCHENLSMPKPDFLLWKKDPSFRSASMHFDNLAQRYPEPIVALNLIKQEESGRPKETLLFDEYSSCIRFLNKERLNSTAVQGMNSKHHEPIAYITFDFLKCARSPNQNVLDAMSEIAASIFNTTGFFRTLNPLASSDARMKDKDVSLKHLRYGIEQHGTLRTNCIDCLDRTNVAQFCLGRICLRAQMEALNINVLDSEEYTLVWQELMKMYADHGNCMGNQYGGSGAMHSLALAKPTSSDGDNGTSRASTKASSDGKHERLILRSPSHSPPRRAAKHTLVRGADTATYTKHGNDVPLDLASDTYTSFAPNAIHSEEKKPPNKPSSRLGMGFSGRFFGLTKSKNESLQSQPDKHEGDDESDGDMIKSSPTNSPSRSSAKATSSAYAEKKVTLTGGAKNAFVAVTRYISNNFSDSDKQRSLDIFLGTYDVENGYSGAKADMERAASTSGGSLFTLERRVLSHACNSVNSSGITKRVEAPFEYESDMLTHFDDEFDSPFSKAIVNNLAEVPEEVSDRIMAEEYKMLHLETFTGDNKIDSLESDRSSAYSWHNSWVSTINGKDFVVHSVPKTPRIDTSLPLGAAHDDSKVDVDKYQPDLKESELLYSRYTNFI